MNDTQQWGRLKMDEEQFDLLDSVAAEYITEAEESDEDDDHIEDWEFDQDDGYDEDDDDEWDE